MAKKLIKVGQDASQAVIYGLIALGKPQKVLLFSGPTTKAIGTFFRLIIAGNGFDKKKIFFIIFGLKHINI